MRDQDRGTQPLRPPFLWLARPRAAALPRARAREAGRPSLWGWSGSSTKAPATRPPSNIKRPPAIVPTPVTFSGPLESTRLPRADRAERAPQLSEQAGGGGTGMSTRGCRARSQREGREYGGGG